MYRYQLSDARNSLALKNISGVASSSAQFVAYVNEAMRRLAKRGDWFGMIQRMRLCFRGCNVTWPRAVGTVIALRGCEGNIPLRNMWYPFTGDIGYGMSGDYPYFWYGYLGSWDAPYSTFGGYTTSNDIGTSCTYNKITGTTGKLIRYYVLKAQDVGKTITIFGKAYGGQPLQELDATSGQWKLGITLTAASPFAVTTVLVTEITSVVRQPTQGMAYLYEYDSASTQMVDLAQYEPNETNPRYRVSRVPDLLYNRVNSDGVSCLRSVEALVKLEFIPVVDDRDFLMVDDFDALKLAIQGVKAEEANDEQTAEIKWLAAIRELNFRDREAEPDNQTSVIVDPCPMLMNPQ